MSLWLISKAERVNSLLPAFLLSTAESVGCLQYLSLSALQGGVGVSNASLRKPSITLDTTVCYRKDQRSTLGLDYGSFSIGWGVVGRPHDTTSSVLVLFLLCTSQNFPGVSSFGLAHLWILLVLDFQYSMITQHRLKRSTHHLNGTPFLSV